MIILVSEDDDNNSESDDKDGFSEASFRHSWQEAIRDDTLPLSQLWEDIDIE